MKAYNGHESFEHWNVALWVSNTELWYRWSLWAIGAKPTLAAAAAALMRRLPTKTPDGVEFTLDTLYAHIKAEAEAHQMTCGVPLKLPTARRSDAPPAQRTKRKS